MFERFVWETKQSGGKVQANQNPPSGCKPLEGLGVTRRVGWLNHSKGLQPLGGLEDLPHVFRYQLAQFFLHPGGTGDDVATEQKILAALEVGHHAARFAEEKYPGGHVPTV